jgi:hypothetical protein
MYLIYRIAHDWISINFPFEPYYLQLGELEMKTSLHGYTKPNVITVPYTIWYSMNFAILKVYNGILLVALLNI